MPLLPLPNRPREGLPCIWPYFRYVIESSLEDMSVPSSFLSSVLPSVRMAVCPMALGKIAFKLKLYWNIHQIHNKEHYACIHVWSSLWLMEYQKSKEISEGFRCPAQERCDSVRHSHTILSPWYSHFESGAGMGADVEFAAILRIRIDALWFPSAWTIGWTHKKKINVEGKRLMTHLVPPTATQEKASIATDLLLISPLREAVVAR